MMLRIKSNVFCHKYNSIYFFINYSSCCKFVYSVRSRFLCFFLANFEKTFIILTSCVFWFINKLKKLFVRCCLFRSIIITTSMLYTISGQICSYGFPVHTESNTDSSHRAKYLFYCFSCFVFVVPIILFFHFQYFLGINRDKFSVLDHLIYKKSNRVEHFCIVQVLPIRIINRKPRPRPVPPLDPRPVLPGVFNVPGEALGHVPSSLHGLPGAGAAAVHARVLIREDLLQTIKKE